MASDPNPRPKSRGTEPPRGGSVALLIRGEGYPRRGLSHVELGVRLVNWQRIAIECRTVGPNRLLQLRLPALPHSEYQQHVAEIHLGHRPCEGYPIRRVFLERCSVSRDRLLQACGTLLQLSQRLERDAEVILVIAQSSGTVSRVLTSNAAR